MIEKSNHRNSPVQPIEFTQDAIIQAGFDLRAEGRKITGLALRQIVGGGHPARLKNVWDEHVERQDAAPPVAELAVEVSDEVAALSKALTERLAAFARQVNHPALNTAGHQVSDEKRRADEAVANAGRKMAAAAQQIDALEAERNAARDEIDELKTALASSQADAQAQAVELVRVRERLTSTEQAARDAAAHHAAELLALTATHEKIETMQAQIADLMRSLTPATAPLTDPTPVRSQPSH